MASAQAGKNPDIDNSSAEDTQKLLRRMGVAGVMILLLLGGLAVFDHYSGPSQPEESPPRFTEPVPVPKKVVTQPVTPAESLPKDEAKVAEPEISAPPADKSPAVLEPPPSPLVAAQPELPKTTPLKARPMASGSGAVVSPKKDGNVPVSMEPQPSAAPVPEKTAEPKSTPPMRVDAAAEPTTAPIAAPLSPPRLLSGFVLQAGVFSDPRRAEDLHAKLLQQGVPASIEARVEVGPFKTKAEALAAREKLKSIGIETMMLPPKKAQR